MAEKEYQFPKVSLCDVVVYSSAPDKSDTSIGIVSRVKSRGVDLLVVTPRGLTARYDCWHMDDPNCLLKRETISQPDRGVFQLSDMTKEVRSLFAHITAIEGFLEKLVTRITQIEQEMPKKPGRPRTREELPAEVVAEAY